VNSAREKEGIGASHVVLQYGDGPGGDYPNQEADRQNDRNRGDEAQGTTTHARYFSLLRPAE
jgi:hypothetical protein